MTEHILGLRATCHHTRFMWPNKFLAARGTCDGPVSMGETNERNEIEI